MKRLALAFLLGVATLAAQTTTVKDVIYDVFSQRLNGTILIENPAFTTVNGQVVAKGKVSVLVHNGVVNIALYPTVGQTDTTGTAVYYTVTVVGALSAQEYWGVSSSGPITISQARALGAAAIGTGSGSGGSGSAAVWGLITGSLADQSDLFAALGLHELTANKDAHSGYAGLDSSGYLKVASECPIASATVFGCLSTTDWTRFNIGGSGVPYSGATGDVTLGTHKLSAAEIDTIDNTASGQVVMSGKTSGSAVTVTVDDSTQLYGVTLPPGAPTQSGAMLQVASAGGVGTNSTTVWSKTAPLATALAAIPTGCTGSNAVQQTDAQGNAVTCIATGGGGGTGPFRQQISYPLCSKQTGTGTSASNGVTTNSSVLAGGGDATCLVNLPAAGGSSVVIHHWLPPSWDASSITATLVWTQGAGGTGSNVEMSFQTYCATNATSTSPSYNSPQVVTVARPSGGVLTTSSMSLTLTGCSVSAVGQILYVKVANTAVGTGGTTFTGDPNALIVNLSVVQ